MSLASKLTFYQIDAFARKRFSGNPAAVCLVPKGTTVPSETMQKIAAENNLAETAFLEMGSGAKGDFRSSSCFGLRWFTPTIEVPLCGHATLASAAALFFEEANVSTEVEFETLSGSLFVKKIPSGEEADGAPMMEMRFPSLPATDPIPPEFESKVVKCLVGDLPVTHVGWQDQVGYLLVVLDDARVAQEQLEAISPDMAALQASTGGNTAIRGAMVTCKGQPGGDGPQVLSRFFAPWAGIPEDPVTGSAHSVLCPYWTKELGANVLTARQCSPRGGDLVMEQAGEDTVLIRGHAVTVISGELSC